MNASERFKTGTVPVLGAKALYVLATVSTSDEIIEEVAERTAVGEKPSPLPTSRR